MSSVDISAMEIKYPLSRNDLTIKGALLGLTQFLANLKMMKNALHFTLKSCFVLKTFKFLS